MSSTTKLLDVGRPGLSHGRRPLAALPLYVAFAGTGIGVALPGAILPALLLRWHLKDAQGGLLFLMAWVGSSAGALLVRGSLRRALTMGGLAVALASFALGVCEGVGANEWMALYGCGLGLTMTSISLIRQQQTEHTGAEMVRLNLLWALGACVCPTLTVRILAGGAIRPLLFGIGAGFLAVTGWAALQEDVRLPLKTKAGQRFLSLFQSVPLPLIAMVFLITGIEASAGGWLATFARRAEATSGHDVATTIAAPTCLWAGLLLSRFVWSVYDRVRAHGQIMRGSLALMSGSAVLLVTAHGGWLMLVAAFCLGFGIGPIYPLLLAWALRFRPGGSIFFIAGVGSAALPWLTGLLSTQRNSLRVGLAVPMAGTLMMLVLSMASPLTRWTMEEDLRSLD